MTATSARIASQLRPRRSGCSVGSARLTSAPCSNRRFSPCGGPSIRTRVAEGEPHLIEIAAHVLALTVHGQDVDAVLAAQVEVGEAVADEARLRADDALHDARVLRRDRLERVLDAGLEDDVALLAQAQDVADIGAQDEAVARLEDDAAALAGERDPVADDVDHARIELLRHTRLVGGLADQR